MPNLVVFNNGMKGIDTQFASIDNNGSLTVSQLTCNGSLTNVGNLSISAGSNLTIIGGDLICSSGTLNSSAVSTGSITTTTLTCNGSLKAQTIEPTYSSLPSYTGKIGQIVSAPTTTPVTLVVFALVQVASLTIPYTGVWAIDMALHLGNAYSLPGHIVYPTAILVNGSTIQNFYGTQYTGVNGSLKRSFNADDVVTFSTYLGGEDSPPMTPFQRAVSFNGYTFLTATRIG